MKLNPFSKRARTLRAIRRDKALLDYLEDRLQDAEAAFQAKLDRAVDDIVQQASNPTNPTEEE